MKLTNFTIGDGDWPIEIVHEGQLYDLHNFGSFEGLQFSPSGEVRLCWRFRKPEFPGSTLLTIAFTALSKCIIDIPKTAERTYEPDCLASMLQVYPVLDRQPIEYRGCRPNLLAETNLVFQFLNGTTIELQAGEATLSIRSEDE